MSKKIIDYSSDSIFKASKRVAKTALKNIQPPPIPITEMPTNGYRYINTSNSLLMEW